MIKVRLSIAIVGEVECTTIAEVTTIDIAGLAAALATETTANFNQSVLNWLGSMLGVEPSTLSDDFIARILQELASIYNSHLYLHAMSTLWYFVVVHIVETNNGA